MTYHSNWHRAQEEHAAVERRRAERREKAHEAYQAQLAEQQRTRVEERRRERAKAEKEAEDAAIRARFLSLTGHSGTEGDFTRMEADLRAWYREQRRAEVEDRSERQRRAIARQF